jgi:hypothetical protein
MAVSGQLVAQVRHGDCATKWKRGFPDASAFVGSNRSVSDSSHAGCSLQPSTGGPVVSLASPKDDALWCTQDARLCIGA